MLYAEYFFLKYVQKKGSAKSGNRFESLPNFRYAEYKHVVGWGYCVVKWGWEVIVSAITNKSTVIGTIKKNSTWSAVTSSAGLKALKYTYYLQGTYYY